MISFLCKMLVWNTCRNLIPTLAHLLETFSLCLLSLPCYLVSITTAREVCVPSAFHLLHAVLHFIHSIWVMPSATFLYFSQFKYLASLKCFMIMLLVPKPSFQHEGTCEYNMHISLVLPCVSEISLDEKAYLSYSLLVPWASELDYFHPIIMLPELPHYYI